MLNKLLSLLVLLSLLGCTPTHRSFPDLKTARQNAKTAADSQEVYLRKISFHLRGLTPTREEYVELDQAKRNRKVDSFFQQKIREYLSSKEHFDKMAGRLEDLFQLRTSPLPFYSPLIFALADKRPYDVYGIFNSMNQVFRDLAVQNLSWDTLLTGKNYVVFPFLRRKKTGNSDAMFFSQVSDISQTVAAPTKISFKDDDTRVAGVLTTSRFFNRYTNTASNKNRRRAAAVFRIFLCDDMKAGVTNEKDMQSPILDKVFAMAHSGNTGGDTASRENLHGTDPACIKCHYKLDPLGKTFEGSGLILSPFASVGGLVYQGKDGRQVNVPARGIGDLAKAITEQPEYSSCQVEHFWRWFIGEDVPMNEELRKELMQQFDSVGRKTNDFISYLVSRPEFKDPNATSATDPLIVSVKRIFQNCNGCHSVQGVPSFTEWPIGGDKETHGRWLGKIHRALGFADKPRGMPPADSKWQPDANELKLLKQWLEDQLDKK